MKNSYFPLTALLGPFALVILLNTSMARAELTLDPNFATNGLAVVDIDTGIDVAQDIAEQDDGALVLAGRSRKTVGADAMDYVALTRLNGSTGALDGTFGTAGIVTFLPGLVAANGAGGEGRAVVIQPLDQKIIVAGTWRSNPSVSSQVFVARFGTNGVLDGGFGTGGVTLFTPAGVTEPTGNAIALRSDGSIAVVGSAIVDGASVGYVVVLDSTGMPDPGYAQAVVPNPLPPPAGANFGFNVVAVLTGNGILAGGGGGDFTLAQFTGAGAPDPGFDGDGIATFNFLSFDTAEGSTQAFDVITALAVRLDGRILIAGRVGGSAAATSTNRVLGQVTSSGALDATFGSAGFAPLPNISDASPEGLGVRPSGDVVLVGQGFNPIQVSPNGIALSPVTVPFPAGLNGLAVLADGNLAAAGVRTVSGANTAFAAVRLTATDLADGPDTVPDPFGFETQRVLEPGVTATSNTVTITGLAAPATISVTSGDSYSIGCSNFTTAAGTISNGETVCVRTEALEDDLRAKYAELNIGGVVGLFALVTGVATPDPFTFVDQTGVAASAVITSAPVPLTGLTVPTNLSVTGPGGTFSVGCTGTFTAESTSVDPGAQICVRHTSSETPGGSISTVLRVGLFFFEEGTFTSTTEGGPDVTPDPFSFTSQADVALSTEITSNAITITGVDAPVTILASGPRDNFDRPLFGFSVGCTGSFDGANGDVANPGDTVCVGVLSAATDSTAVEATLTIGGTAPSSQTSATFTVTTGETVPDPFTFTDQVGVLLDATVYLDPITITGITAPARVEISQNGQYQINCAGPFTRSAGVVRNNETICVRQFAAGSLSTLTNTVLTVGGVSDTFTSTTVVDKPLPGGSAMDVWALGLLAPLVLYRLRRSGCRSAFRRDP